MGSCDDALRPHQPRAFIPSSAACEGTPGNLTPQVCEALLTMERHWCTRNRGREGPRDRQAPAGVLQAARGDVVRGELALLIILSKDILPIGRKDDPLLVF